MQSDELMDKIDSLVELTGEAKAASKRLVNNPQNARDEVENFEGLNGVALDTLHSFAYEFYQNGKYLQAASFFQVLSSLDMLCFDYWMGLGASQLMAREYQEALTAYSIASSLKVDDPHPHFHAAECYKSLNDTAQALRVLEVAEDFCTNSESHLPLKDRIKLFRESWKG
jgi:type III secretion system low calcium response chaperone LcrH/SycD